MLQRRSRRHLDILPGRVDGMRDREREVASPGPYICDSHSGLEGEALENGSARQPLLAVRVVEHVDVLVWEHPLVSMHVLSASTALQRSTSTSGRILRRAAYPVCDTLSVAC